MAVELELASLSDELKPSEDRILMVSLGVKDLSPTIVFLFFSKEEGIIVWLGFCGTTGSSFRFLRKPRGPLSSILVIFLGL